MSKMSIKETKTLQQVAMLWFGEIAHSLSSLNLFQTLQGTANPWQKDYSIKIKKGKYAFFYYQKKNILQNASFLEMGK